MFLAFLELKWNKTVIFCKKIKYHCINNSIQKNKVNTQVYAENIITYYGRWGPW
jgi:hypothetical protein